MQFTCLQENLFKGLSFVNHFIPTRPSLPILTNVLLKGEKGELTLSATNLEMGISLRIGARIEKEGAITIPAKILLELISSLPSGKIEFLKEEDNLKIISQNLKTSINGFSASEFPPLPSPSGKTTFSFSTEEILKALSKVIFSASQDEGRPILNGVLFKGENGKLILAATDGFRLSVKTLSFNSSCNFVLPARALLEVMRILEEEKEKELKIEVTEEKNQVIFCFSNGEIICRLLEGKFPDFENIIPKNFSTKALLEKEPFISAIKTLSVFARETSNIIKLKISSPKENRDSKLEIEASAPQVGEGMVETEAKTEGEEMEVAFNYRFLLDFLNTVSQEEVIFQTNGPLSPGVFKPVGDESYFHVIMPVRIQPEEI